MYLLSKLKSTLPLRWVRVFKHHNNEDSTKNEGSSSSSIPVQTPSVECYACTQEGVPAFHSTSCDKAHSPKWEANAGSSLIPIQNIQPRAHRHITNGWIFGQVLDPCSKKVQRWNRVILLSRAVALAVDPLFFYSLSIGRGGAPCLYMDGGLAVIVTMLRTFADVMHLMHVWLQFKLAYVSRESLVVGCGKLIWDARLIAKHYFRSIKGFWFDIFVILPVPQMNLMDRNVKEEREYSNPIEEAHLAKRERRSNMKRNVICYYCEKADHILKFYNKLKKDKKRMKALEEGQNKHKENSDDEINFDHEINDNVLCVDNDKCYVLIKTKEKIGCLIQVHVSIYASKMTMWHLQMVAIWRLLVYVQ